MHPMLNVAVKAARRAGRIITRASIDLDTIKIARKQQNDFVTEVDRASEEAIIETLRAAYPDHLILAEESGLTGGPKSGPIPDDALALGSNGDLRLTIAGRTRWGQPRCAWSFLL